MSKFRRKNYLIYKRMQLKYALLTISLLIAYSVILLSAIFAPYFSALFSDLPLMEKAVAADVILILHSNIWFGIGVIIILCGIYSIFTTHRIVGPVFVFNRMVREVTKGNLTLRARLRKGDEHQDVAANLNKMVDNLESSLLEVDSDYQKLLSYISELEADLKSHGVPQQRLEDLAKEKGLDKEAVKKFLERYQLSSR